MISAKVIADSISEAGKRITTFELEYHRFIHSEFMTHRQFSRNAASSRATPVKKMIEQVRSAPAKPVHWGANQPGMQADREVGDIVTACSGWLNAARWAAKYAQLLADQGLHKQIVNRILEPFQHIKVVCTATEYDNFFMLRAHKDAQPEIQELAFKMLDASAASEPRVLRSGQWHLPYVTEFDESKYSLSDARKLSASLCAQVSYRASDTSLEKALAIYEKLVTMRPVHASPFEHQATPMAYPSFDYNEPDLKPEEGITHTDTDQDYWSGNFKGWVQNRQLIEGSL